MEQYDDGPWDDFARDLLETAGLGPPVDPLHLAAAYRLEVRVGRRVERACTVGRVIVVPDGLRPQRAGFAVLHEMAHLFLRGAGMRDEEAACDALAAALLLPRAAFDRDLRATWALPELRARHPHASHEALARRILSLRPAVVTIADRMPRKRDRRLRAPSLGARLPAATPIETELVAEAEARGEPAGSSDMARAWPIRETGAHRILLVAHADELESASS